MKQDKNHLEMVRSLPCLVCGSNSIAHHVRNGRNAGMGQKPDSRFCVPLCVSCHHDLHQIGEDVFWRSHQINPFEELMMIMTRRGTEIPF